MENILIYFLILLASFPVAYLIFKLCKDEIKNWRRRLKLISIISLSLSIALFFTDHEFKLSIIVSLVFIAIMNFTIIWISYRNK